MLCRICAKMLFVLYCIVLYVVIDSPSASECMDDVPAIPPASSPGAEFHFRRRRRRGGHGRYRRNQTKSTPIGRVARRPTWEIHATCPLTHHQRPVPSLMDLQVRAPASRVCRRDVATSPIRTLRSFRDTATSPTRPDPIDLADAAPPKQLDDVIDADAYCSS